MKKYIGVILKGFLAVILLLVIFFTVTSLISSWVFAKQQFSQYWYYLITLAIGFGIQVGLYSFLRQSIKEKASGGVLAATGTTSTLAMISCCAHYLANILPIIGIGGLVAFVAQYQVKLFWVGILFNIAGIIFISWRIRKFLRGV